MKEKIAFVPTILKSWHPNFKNINIVITTIIKQLYSLNADRKYIMFLYAVGIMFAIIDNVINIKVNILASKTHFIK